MSKKQLIQCPYCNESKPYDNWADFEKHKKDCLCRFRPQTKDRFNAKINKKIL